MPIKLMCTMQFSLECRNKQDHLRRSGQDFFSLFTFILFFQKNTLCNLGKASKKNGKEAVRLTAWVDPPCLTASFPFFFDAFPKLHNVFF